MKSSEDDILPNFPNNNQKKYIHAYKIANYLEPSLRARNNTPIIQSHQPHGMMENFPKVKFGAPPGPPRSFHEIHRSQSPVGQKTSPK